MDLSKIPEPSEEDLQIVQEAISGRNASHHPFETSFVTVICRMARDGAILAKGCKELNSRICEGADMIYADERAAIEFFEKFGGNDER